RRPAGVQQRLGHRTGEPECEGRADRGQIANRSCCLPPHRTLPRSLTPTIYSVSWIQSTFPNRLRKVLMTFAIGEGCVDVRDRSCVDVCPVDCIYEGDRKLYIN